MRTYMKKIEPIVIERIGNMIHMDDTLTIASKVNTLIASHNALQEQVEGMSIQLDLLKGSMSEKAVKTTSNSSVPTPTPVEEKDRMAKYVQTIRAINSTPPLQEQEDSIETWKLDLERLIWSYHENGRPDGKTGVIGNPKTIEKFVESLLSKEREAVRMETLEFVEKETL